ncbi:hypothetical protein JCM9957A_51180 [Kineosporia succinea]
MFRKKPARMVVATLLSAGALVAATPALAQAADVGTACNGSPDMGSGTVNTYELSITVDGVTYGWYRVGKKDEDGGSTIKIAVKDTRADGLAPYVRAFETTSGGTTYTQSDRFINRLGSANGWVCATYFTYRVVKLRISGSVADAPSIPEPNLVSIYY